MNKKKVIGFFAVVLSLSIFCGIKLTYAIDADYNRPMPLMDYVPQEIGIYDTGYEELVEDDCRGCHGASLADRHHATEAVLVDGSCVPCHTPISEPPGVTVTKDCLTSGCHSPDDLVVNGWHHDTDMLDSHNCVACHNPNLIAKISPVKDVGSYPPSVVMPTPFSCENCHWEQDAFSTGLANDPGHPSTYDHYGANGTFVGAHEYSKPIYGNFDTHHMGFVGSLAGECYRCHSVDPAQPSWSPYDKELIRYCEACHDPASLRTIGPHVGGGPGWVAEGFHVDSDVPTDVDPSVYRTSDPTGFYAPETEPGFSPNEMCIGCHGDTVFCRVFTS